MNLSFTDYLLFAYIPGLWILGLILFSIALEREWYIAGTKKVFALVWQKRKLFFILILAYICIREHFIHISIG